MHYEWKRLTSEDRIPKKTATSSNQFRSEIESDYHRIIKSASFRRLQDKTQVFPLDQSDFVRTRLTHSLEVSSLAKLIGKQVCSKIYEAKLEKEAELPDPLKVIEILNCAGLLHDIGNPPFGHFGETAIRNWFVKQLPVLTFQGKPLTEVLDEQQQLDLKYFEGNAQALRIITKLHRLIGDHGMHLTSAVMDTIIKYPVNSIEMAKQKNAKDRKLTEKKIGYFQSEKKQFERIKANTGTVGTRNPLCYILEAADDLAYTFADLEDGYNKGLYTFHQLLEVVIFAKDDYGANLLQQLYQEGLDLAVDNEEGFDSYHYAVFTWLTRKQLFCVSAATDAFLNHYHELMQGTFCEELLACSSQGTLIGQLKRFAFQKIYNHASILKVELMGNEIISFLLTQFVDALLVFDSGETVSEIQEKYIALLSGNYVENYLKTTKGSGSDAEKLYHRLLLATDYISGMSDSFAKSLYRELKGIG